MSSKILNYFYRLSAGILSLGLTSAFAEDKSQFTLLNPTPREFMRELSTDRPDATESPYTVDAGHFQLETSIVDYTRNDQGSGSETYSWMSSNLKIGLLNDLDIQIVFEPFVEDKSVEEDISGFGNVQIRLKNNLWGNDSGDYAIALMPFVQFPTGQGELNNNHFEGGLIVPVGISLPNEFSLGLMAEIDFIRNEDNDDYGSEFVHTATVGHSIIGDLSGFLEYVGTAPRKTGTNYSANFGGGITYAVSEDTQLDLGAYFPLNDNADDLNLFIGFSLRS